MFINLEKYVIDASSKDFLEHMVLAQEVCPLPPDVHSVENFPQPDTVEQLQAFLGLINFYRHFLPAIARTLRQLTNALEGEIRSNDDRDSSNLAATKSAEQGHFFSRTL